MPRREHDDRGCEQPAQLAADVHASRIGKAQVEDDELRPLGGCRMQPFRTGRRLADAIRDLAQSIANGDTNLWFVVDDENAGGLVHAVEGSWARPLAPARREKDVDLVGPRIDEVETHAPVRGLADGSWYRAVREIPPRRKHDGVRRPAEGAIPEERVTNEAVARAV